MQTAQTVKRRRLPSGHNLADYRGYEKWSIHRWAWEFLCRNEDFIDACSKPAKSPGAQMSSRMRIARQFHLARFKHCLEPYHEGEKPSFRPVKIWRCTQLQKKRVCTGIEIHQGEVLIRFSLEPALHSSNAVVAQLLSAEKVLKEHARMLARLRNTKLPRSKAKIGADTERIRWLRMLDAKRHAKSAEEKSKGEAWTHSEIYRNLFPDIAKGLERDQLARKFKDAFRTAVRCTQHTYLEMALTGQKESASRGIKSVESDDL